MRLLHNLTHTSYLPKNSNGMTIKELNEGLQEEKFNNFTNLPELQKTTLGLLKSGRPFSAKLLLKITPDRDPRSTIRYLRRRGYKIVDTWVTGDGPRYKLYFLDAHSQVSQLPLFTDQ